MKTSFVLRGKEIAREWKFNTRAKLEAGDVLLTAIIKVDKLVFFKVLISMYYPRIQLHTSYLVCLQLEHTRGLLLVLQGQIGASMENLYNQEIFGLVICKIVNEIKISYLAVFCILKE